jgi:D-lactate dehydrogenase (cytochrome)
VSDSSSHWTVRTRAPRPGASALRRESDPDVVSGYLQDAARYPGGHAAEVCFPASEADVAALLVEGLPLLVVGAQSSLTGGATPHGEVVVSTSRLASIDEWTASSVRCGPGVVLRDLEEAAAARDVYFPPVPTYDGATVGGVVSTDAAGAATFKHGTVRAWVEGLTVVLACGEVLDLERGRVHAHPDGWFEVVKLDGEVLRVPLPRPACPRVPKISAGYRGGDGLDLVDLFVGSEGTLGVVTSVRLRLVGPRPQWLAVLVPVAGDDEAINLTRELRDEALRTRSERDPDGVDVCAIEYMDARCLEILREDHAPERVGVPLPPEARALLLVQVELPPDYDRARALDELASSDVSAKGPVASLCRLLESRGLLADAVPALPGEESRRRALFALREAVPEGVNARVRERQRVVDGAITKSGGDVIVPFERFAESLSRYRALIAEAGLDAAVWGHISDGNVHPNLLAADAAEMIVAREVQTAIGRTAIELGGSPLAEHGTGRNAAKKALLLALHGEAGVASMRTTKRALDPDWILAPGVLFDREGPEVR